MITTINTNWSKLLGNRHFPSCQVVKTLPFHCRKRGFDPWWGSKIPHATHTHTHTHTHTQITPNFGEQTLLIQPVGTELG